MALSELIDEYELTITQGTAPSAVAAKETSASGSYKFDFNYNPTSASVIFSDLGIKTPLGSVNCHNCYTRGSTGLEFKLRSKWLVVLDYSLKINGEMFTNMDLQIHVPTTKQQYVFYDRLGAIGLSPLHVPKVFNFGPQLVLDTGISYSVTEPVDLAFGYDLSHSFDFEISGNFFSKPKIDHHKSHHFNQHKFNHTKDIQIDVEAHLIPKFSIDLSVFELEVVGMDLALDNSLGLEFNWGKFTQCPTDPFDIVLFEQQDFSFNIHALLWHEKVDIWHHRENVACFFCSPCQSLPSS
ncbi:hypothetical protein HDU91_004326, partial [Kappamyces sp. JEL0680]